MKNISAFAVGMPNVGVAWDPSSGATRAHAATAAYAAAPIAAAEQRKRRTAAATAASMDGGAI